MQAPILEVSNNTVHKLNSEYYERIFSKTFLQIIFIEKAQFPDSWQKGKSAFLDHKTRASRNFGYFSN